MLPYGLDLMLAERRREIEQEIAHRQLLRSLAAERPRRPLLHSASRRAGCRVGKLLVRWGERLQSYGAEALPGPLQLR